MARLLAAALLGSLLALAVLPAVATAQEAPAAAAPGDTLRLSLSEAILRSLRVSPEVDAREAERAFAEARSDLAQASRFLTEFGLTTAHAVAPGLENLDPDVPSDELYLDPDVRNDWDDLRPFNRAEVALTQPLWTWGELSGSIRAARHGIAVEAAEVRAQELEVAFRTGEIYYNVLLTEALARIAEDAGETVDRARREIERLLEEGAEGVDYADLFQVQITEQEYRRRLVEVRQSRLLARSALARQLFLPEGALALPDTSLLTPLAFELDTLAYYTGLALAHRPELDQAEAGIAARKALVDVAASDYYPKLFLGASASISYAAGRFRQPNPYVGDPFRGRSTRAGLGLRQELNFFQTRAEVEQAEAELNEVRFQQEAAQQLIRFEVEEAYRQLRIAQAALEAQDEALRISGEWLRTEQINFDLDLGDPENLVRAVQQNLGLEVAYYQAVRDYNVAVLRLLRVCGLLNSPAKAGTLVDFR